MSFAYPDTSTEYAANDSATPSTVKTSLLPSWGAKAAYDDVSHFTMASRVAKTGTLSGDMTSSSEFGKADETTDPTTCLTELDRLAFGLEPTEDPATVAQKRATHFLIKSLEASGERDTADKLRTAMCPSGAGSKDARRRTAFIINKLEGCGEFGNAAKLRPANEKRTNVHERKRSLKTTLTPEDRLAFGLDVNAEEDDEEIQQFTKRMSFQLAAQLDICGEHDLATKLRETSDKLRAC